MPPRKRSKAWPRTARMSAAASWTRTAPPTRPSARTGCAAERTTTPEPAAARRRVAGSPERAASTSCAPGASGPTSTAGPRTTARVRRESPRRSHPGGSSRPGGAGARSSEPEWARTCLAVSIAHSRVRGPPRSARRSPISGDGARTAASASRVAVPLVSRREAIVRACGSSTSTTAKARRFPTSVRGSRSSTVQPPSAVCQAPPIRLSGTRLPSSRTSHTETGPSPSASTAKRRSSSSAVTTAISRWSPSPVPGSGARRTTSGSRTSKRA